MAWSALSSLALPNPPTLHRPTQRSRRSRHSEPRLRRYPPASASGWPRATGSARCSNSMPCR